MDKNSQIFSMPGEKFWCSHQSDKQPQYDSRIFEALFNATVWNYEEQYEPVMFLTEFKVVYDDDSQQLGVINYNGHDIIHYAYTKAEESHDDDALEYVVVNEDAFRQFKLRMLEIIYPVAEPDVPNDLTENFYVEDGEIKRYKYKVYSFTINHSSTRFAIRVPDGVWLDTKHNILAHDNIIEIVNKGVQDGLNKPLENRCKQVDYIYVVNFGDDVLTFKNREAAEEYVLTQRDELLSLVAESFERDGPKP